MEKQILNRRVIEQLGPKLIQELKEKFESQLLELRDKYEIEERFAVALVGSVISTFFVTTYSACLLAQGNKERLSDEGIDKEFEYLKKLLKDNLKIFMERPPTHKMH